MKINCHPRARYNYALGILLKSLRIKNHEIVLGIDANLARPNNPTFQQLLLDSDLIDVIKHRHGEPPATYRGNTRPDIIAATPSLLEFIEANGHLGDDHSCQSDHTGLFLDLSNRIFKPNKDPTLLSSRGFTSRNKSKFKKYGIAVDRNLSNNQFLQSLLQLLPTAPLSAKQELCDSIDNIITTTMIREENKLAFQPDIIAWSPIYATHRRSYLNTRKKLRKFCRTHPFPLLEQDQHSYSILQRQMKANKSILRSIEKQAIHHRLEFLLGKIKSASEANNQKLLKALRAIYRSERRQFAFKKLSPIVKGETPSSLVKILTTDSITGNQVELTTKDEMNDALLRRNINHFNQASETPFTQPPLSEITPPFQPSPDIAQRILNGDLSDFQDQSNIIIEFLANLEKLPNTTTFKYEFAEDDFITGMKAISEGKTSSQSGRHYSLYKALLAFPFSMQIISTLISQCTTNNILLSRWIKVLQVMLCKIPGNFSIEKLRVIQLIEADLNLFLRLLWGKRLVQNIIKNNNFPPEQMGSRPGFQCSSAALLKTLSFDLIRILRASATIFNNDAKACYDRVIPFLALLCCQSLGLPSEAATFLLNFLRSAEYRVKTCFGISNDFYSNVLRAIYGVLQGSGSAPAIWLSVSLMLIKTYNKKFISAEIPNPTLDNMIDKIIDMFVDDADLWDIIFDTCSTEYLMIRLEERAQYWEKLLFATGGKLNFQKCYWYIVQWVWDDNGIPSMLSPDDLPATLRLTNGTSSDKIQIKRKAPTQSLKTLGVYTSPSGQNADQYTAIEDFLTHTIQEIKTTKMTQLEASLIIPVYLHSKLRYIFAATTFNKNDCDALDRLYRPVLLAKMGISSKTNLDIVHSSHKYGGLRIPNSWDLQGSLHLHLLAGHLQLQDMVGQHMMHAIEYSYLHIGLPEPIFSYDYTIIADIIPASWISNTWEYISSIGGTITTKAFTLQPQRQHDIPIMQLIIQHYSGITRQRLNAVRKYLKVFFLSDITTSCGRYISDEYLYDYTTPSRKSLLKWPIQDCPGSTAWREWRAFFRKYLSNKSFRLYQQLGLWLQSPHPTQQWTTVIDTAEQRVFIKTNHRWIKYQIRGHSQLLFHSITTEPTSSMLPVSIKEQGNKFYHLPYARRQITPTPMNSPPSTFLQYIKTLPQHEQTIIGHIVRLRSWEVKNLIDMLHTGDFSIGSDGSVTGSKASYSSMLHHNNILAVFTTAYSLLSTNSSFIAESYGHLSALYLLRAFITYYAISPSYNNIPAYIDNQGLLTRLSYKEEHSVKHCQATGAALSREIIAVEKTLPFKISRHHVKSHQYDNVSDESTIPLPSLINKKCDKAADKAYHNKRCKLCPSPILPTTRCYVTYNNNNITDNIHRRFLYAKYDNQLLQYIIDKEKWTPATVKLIHWDYLDQCFHRATAKQQKAFMKITHKKWATNHRLGKQNNRHDNRCKRCNRIHEDWEHIFRCKSQHSQHSTKQQLQILQAFLTQSLTSAPFTKCITTGIAQWINGDIITFPIAPDKYNDNHFHLLQNAFQQQTNVGWDHLLRGRICSTWFDAHDVYFQQAQLPASFLSRVLGPCLVKALLSFSLQTWINRNQFQYGIDKADSMTRKNDQAIRDITSAYANRDAVTPLDASRLYHRPLQDLLQLSYTAKKNWLHFYNICIHPPPDDPDPLPAPPDIPSPVFQQPRQLHPFFDPYKHLY